MILLLSKPQFVDSKSKITTEGIDIMLSLDVSGSMSCFDDLQDRRSRWSIAKQEALRFIDKRDSDCLGLVVFGRYAITRCPLTNDKQTLKKIIEDFEIGMPSHDMQNGTVLSQSILTAVRRLQNSNAKTKVIVLLTDGEPTDNDLSEKEAIQIANKIGVKIYTIGIGSQDTAYIDNPGYGILSVSSSLNKKLLQKIAKETSGRFFEAKNPEDLKKIYETIDQLEKTEYEVDVYAKYTDYFMPFLWIVVLLILCELFMATFVWFIV